MDNVGNTRGVAPSRYNGAVWSQTGSFEGSMKKLAEKKAAVGNTLANNDDNSAFWLPSLGSHGKAPITQDDYVFYRNVLDYGADNTGTNNTEEAINVVIIFENRCGEDFCGDPNDRPIIKGCDTFTGIALMDVNRYISGSGINRYISQNQFFQQIRNLVFDLSSMPAVTDENGQPLVLMGIHWQVSQACTLQNLLFCMPISEDLWGKSPTHVGIFPENGSGGIASDLVFEGGAIRWPVGSQQYTATSLQFRNCSTVVDMIKINGGSIGLNISGIGGLKNQDIDTVSIIDSVIKNVPTDSSLHCVLLIGTNDPIIEGRVGTKEFTLWEYIRNQGGSSMGESIGDRPRPGALLDSTGKLFTHKGCFNNGTGENTDAITAFLKKALAAKQVTYFPAGMYSIQVSNWSQIQATGSYFSDMANPKPGDVGTMEIADMLFTTKAATTGATMMERSLHDSKQAAALWDSHQNRHLPQALLHTAKGASGYFENFWVWEMNSNKPQISVWRGILIISQRPVEHSMFYQYQLLGAKNVYLGHIQTESPYFQPRPGLRILSSESIMVRSADLYSFFNNFSQICTSSESCQDRIMEICGSKDISVYNIFTKAVVEIATGSSDDSSIELTHNDQHSFTGEINVWFSEGSEPEYIANIVYVGPEVATRTTLTIPFASIVSTVIPVANYSYTSQESEGAPLWVTPSIDLTPTPIVLTTPDGVVTTGTLTLPPWPQITFASDDTNTTIGVVASTSTIHTASSNTSVYTLTMSQPSGAVPSVSSGDGLATYSEFPIGIYIEMQEDKPNDDDDSSMTH
ncbi:Exo-beta-1,3-glucanase [Triangularia setosa]|uniref:Exo-beta-1,3-glucanase n=1 Tax=Triangularia setosa TaxID=2587417 RepID=A0AAN6W3W2_9PEZI|nr:Exo-beta-1,3-glucanase [Podospora setosa]